ncbi:MAG: hypothetical protein GX952_05920 [Firmicutes bacterium]|nr:hypothetical protein [Bacillota bacterium]
MEEFLYRACLRVILALEAGCVRWPGFGRLYQRLFYLPLLKEEISLARLMPGERVLHIGGGSYPCTALQLARSGCFVCLIDSDGRAVSNAKRVVARNRMSRRIEVIKADGRKVLGDDYDAIWISLLVQPKEKIISRLLPLVLQNKTKRIVYRNPRGIFKQLYPTVDAHKLISHYNGQLAALLTTKKSVVIMRREV